MERRNFFQIEEEKQKQQDLMNKMYAAQNDEQNNYLNQIKNFEIEIKKLKADQSVQSKYIDDIKKNLELKPILVSNNFICAGVAFCASSKTRIVLSTFQPLI